MSVELVDGSGRPLGQISTNVGYVEMLDHLDECGSAPDLKRFLETGETSNPKQVSEQAHGCAAHAELELRGSFMTISGLLRTCKGRVQVE